MFWLVGADTAESPFENPREVEAWAIWLEGRIRLGPFSWWRTKSSCRMVLSMDELDAKKRLIIHEINVREGTKMTLSDINGDPELRWAVQEGTAIICPKSIKKDR